MPNALRSFALSSAAFLVTAPLTLGAVHAEMSLQSSDIADGQLMKFRGRRMVTCAPFCAAQLGSM